MATKRPPSEKVVTPTVARVIPTFTEPLSATRVKTFLDCPHAFYLQHVLKIPQATGSPMIEGQAMHKVMEIANVEKVKQGVPWKKERFVKAWGDIWQSRKKDVESWSDDDNADTVERRGNAFVDDYSKQLAFEITAQRADTVEQELLGETGSTKVISHVDLISDTPRVLDYKVTKNASRYKAATSIQLGLYSWITGIKKVGYVFFKKLKTPKVEVEVAERSKISIDRVLNVVNAVAACIKAGNFPYTDPDSWKCQQQYCSVWNHCKNGAGSL